MKHTHAIDAISQQITALEARRDYNNDFTSDETELLSALNFCYDLLSRTEIISSITVPTPEEMKEPGMDDDMIQRFGIVSNQLADEVLQKITKP